jgi:hypothetical protein
MQRRVGPCREGLSFRRKYDSITFKTEEHHTTARMMLFLCTSTDAEAAEGRVPLFFQHKLSETRTQL